MIVQILEFIWLQLGRFYLIGIKTRLWRLRKNIFEEEYKLSSLFLWLCVQPLTDALIANISWYLERIALLFVILPLARSSMYSDYPILAPIIARERRNLSTIIVFNSKGSAVAKFSGSASYDMALVFDFDLSSGTLDLWRLRLWSFSFILLNLLVVYSCI